MRYINPRLILTLKRAYPVHYCMSPMGRRFQMLLSHTLVFGEIDDRSLHKKTKNLIT